MMKAETHNVQTEVLSSTGESHITHTGRQAHRQAGMHTCTHACKHTHSSGIIAEDEEERFSEPASAAKQYL